MYYIMTATNKNIPPVKYVRGTARFDTEVSQDGGKTWIRTNVAVDAPMSVALLESDDGTAEYVNGEGTLNMYRFPQ